MTNKNLYRFAIAAAVLTYILIVVGGIVRVTESGLGCPDWPTCYSEWVPPAGDREAFIEYSHRSVAGITSVFIGATALLVWRNYRKVRLLYQTVNIAVLLLVIQVLLGGVVVLMETPPDLVAVHMGNSLLILGLMVLVAAASAKDEILPEDKKLGYSSPVNKSVLWTTIAVYIVLISGAYVAGSNSTYGCGGWPLCNGALIPVAKEGWIHMIHRLFVLAVSILVWVNYQRVRKQSQNTLVRNWSLIALVFFFLQALVGALKTTYGFHIIYLGLHVAVAAAVWGAQAVAAAHAGLEE